MYRIRALAAALAGGLLLAGALTATPATAAVAMGPQDPCVGVAHPFDNDGRISGTETIPVYVHHPDYEPVRAELFVDGTLVGVDDSAWPVTEGGCGIVYLFEVQWDTTQWPNGPHQVNARATMPDGGQYWSSNTLTLDVEN